MLVGVVKCKIYSSAQLDVAERWNTERWNNMFAVIKSGGKQYRASVGEELVVNRLPVDVGQTVDLPVGLVAGEGQFDLSGRTAKAEVLEHLRGDKIHIWKYKPKKTYRKKTGHRQDLTRIRILEVSDGA